MHSDITTIRFKGTSGFLSLFNIYNKITNNDTLACLDSFSELNALTIHPSPTDSVVWLGNFNRHHPMWEDDVNDQLFNMEDNITPLINLLYKYDIVLALPKGIPTLQTSAGNWTRPDSMWRNSTSADPVLRCNTVPAIRPPLADHLPLITILDLPFPRSSTDSSLNFREADWPAICTDLKQRLKGATPAKHIESHREFI